MAKEKRERQHVFSARTTEEGLKALNGLRANLGVGWDALVIDAVSAHYGLDRAKMSLPPKARKDAKPKAKAEGETGTREPKKRTAGEKTDGAAEREEAGR